MFKKIFKKIKKVLKPVGKAFKKVMKPFAKIQQKLGPVGTMALMFIAPYALPAIWGAFGTWVGMAGGAAAGSAAATAAAGASFNAMSAGMQGLMQGLYGAGMKIGAAYNTVTGFISDTVGKIAGNTIGKIPVGADQTVGSLWKNFTDNLSMKMGAKNLELGKGLGKGFDAATRKVDFVNDALSKIKTPGVSEAFSTESVLSKSLLDKGALTTSLPESSIQNIFNSFTKSKSPLVDGPFSNLSLSSSSFDVGNLGEKAVTNLFSKGSLSSSPVISGNFDITGLTNAKFDPVAAAQANDPYFDVITSLKNEPVLLDAKYSKNHFGKTEVDRLVPEYTRVRQSVLNDNPKLLAEAESLNDYYNNINAVTDKYIDTGILYEPSKIAQARMKETADKAFDYVDKIAGVVGDQTEAERLEAERLAKESRYANMQLAQSIAPIGYSGIQDFSSDFSNLSSTYSAAGYGPQANFMTPQSQYEAGAYGGAGFMNQVSSRFLQPTIAMPRLA